MKIKNRKFLVFSGVFALALSIGVTSCKKDKDDNGASSQLSANLNGTAFQPSVVSAFASSGEILVSGFQLKSGDTTWLNVTVPDTVTVNTVNDFDVADVDYTSSKTDYTSWSSRSHGTVTVTTFDKSNKKIAGKFSGVIYQWGSSTDSVVVKDGQFNTTYKTF